MKNLLHYILAAVFSLLFATSANADVLSMTRVASFTGILPTSTPTAAADIPDGIISGHPALGFAVPSLASTAGLKALPATPCR